MKHYRYLVPVILVAIYIASFSSLQKAKASEEQQYEEYLENARNFRELDIQIDAVRNYQAAINERPSYDLYMELGEFYTEKGRMRDAGDWGEEIVSKYPYEPGGYEFLMGIYVANQDYTACYELHDKFAKRGLTSDYIDELIHSIEYRFYYNGEFEEVSAFTDGLCAVGKNGYWCYVNTRGSKATEYVFTEAGLYSSELAPVVMEGTDPKAFFIDSEGNKKHVVQGVDHIEELGAVRDGIFPLYNGTEWSFYTLDDEFLFGGFSEVSPFGNGYAAVQKEGQWQIIDENGSSLTSEAYEDVIIDEKGCCVRYDRAFVKKGGYYAMIDLTGMQIGSQTFEDARLFTDASLAAVKVNGKWGFVDFDGNMIIPPTFSDARSFSNDLAAVQKDGTWGYIDLNGVMVIDNIFFGAKDMTDRGTAFVNTGEHWELLRLYKYNH